MATSKRALQSRRRSNNLFLTRCSLSTKALVLLALLNCNQPSRVVARLSDLTLFNAIDSNHDHSISEVEYTIAVNKLIGLDDGDGDGVAGDSGGEAAEAAAPPLGLDSHPQNFQHRKSAAAAGNGGGSAANDKLKFDNPASTASFLKALFASFSAIMATEIGDKTFFIAAILSMRNDRLAVFGGAILALIIMTILSTMMGLILPSIMPRKYTHIIGGILFLYFGCKLLLDSRNMEDKVSEELEEVEEELAEMSKKQSKVRKKQKKKLSDWHGPVDGEFDTEMIVEDVDGQMEKGDGENGAKKRRGGGVAAGKSLKQAPLKQPPSSGMSMAVEYSGSSWEGVFTQALTMTFLAEWGDRSQIATIALAAAKDPIGVTIGGCMGHSICTGMAVLGGRMLASRISEKSVSFYGGMVFLAFGFHSFIFDE